MKHLKMLGLFAMAAAALMAFAGSASAATFTAPAGTEYTGKLSSSLEGSALLKASLFNDTCTTSTVAGELTANTESHASGPTTNVSFSNCTVTTTTLSSKGTLTIAKGTRAVSGTGVEVTTGAFGFTCIYGLGAGTSLGTAKNTASGVTLTINAKLPLQPGSSGGCANPAEWTGNYIVTSPAASVVD
jgi:hypothetical protein